MVRKVQTTLGTTKKNKKDGGCAEEDKDETSTQKRQRIKWPGHLHYKFVEAINKIGMDSMS
jgi:two-component response regulator (ARR-B family)